MLPDREVAAILKKFGPEIEAYLKSQRFFDIAGPYTATDLLNPRAMAAYRKASLAKNHEVWSVLEKWLFPEMVDFGTAFIVAYGLIKPPNVREIATDYMKARGGFLIKRMTQTDQKRLTAFIWQNSMKNERPLARQILKEPNLGSIVAGHRPETIIRTERGRAIRSGARSISLEAGAKSRIRREVGDHRTRPSHRKIMGEEVPMDRPYSNGEMYPGEVDINCRGWEEFNFSPKVADHPHPSMAKLQELYG